MNWQEERMSVVTMSEVRQRRFLPPTEDPDVTISEKRLLGYLAPLVTGGQIALGKWGSHSVRLARYAYLVAIWMGASEVWARRYLIAAFLHDLGKLSEECRALFEHERVFTDEEKERADRHTIAGTQMLTIEHFQGILGFDDECIWQIKAGQLTHHTAYNCSIKEEHYSTIYPGRPYERNLTRKSIPLVGRILAVVDTFDALHSHRGYKRTWSREDTGLYLLLYSGTKFDPEIVDVFIKKVLKLKIKHARLKVGLLPLIWLVKDIVFAVKRWYRRKTAWKK